MKLNGKLNRQFPELAKEFHPTLNGAIRPKDVDVSQKKTVYWWKCHKKNCKADFKATVRQRVTGEVGCPI